MPCVGDISKFAEALTGEFKYDLSVHFACGAGCYLFIEPNGKITPITEFLDVYGLMEHLHSAINEMEGRGKLARKSIAAKALLGIGKFIDKEKQPKSLNFTSAFPNSFVIDFNLFGLKLSCCSISTPWMYGS